MKTEKEIREEIGYLRKRNLELLHPDNIRWVRNRIDALKWVLEESA